MKIDSLINNYIHYVCFLIFPLFWFVKSKETQLLISIAWSLGIFPIAVVCSLFHWILFQ
jgi:uncharacterized membrane protein